MQEPRLYNGEMFNLPAIVTNKHVVRDAGNLVTTFTRHQQGVDLLPNGTAPGETHYTLRVEGVQTAVISHPDPGIDLCVIPCQPYAEHAREGGILRHAYADKTWRLPEDEVSYFRPIERIVMVGYPSGLWDEANNRPLVRSGLTATHALLHWKGRREFVIDAACFPGSSGSPVFLYEDGMYHAGPNEMSPGTRVRLLGILWGGPTVSLEGRLEQREIPTGTSDVPVVNAMMNLGFVIHASVLDDFESLLMRQVLAAQGFAD